MHGSFDPAWEGEAQRWDTAPDQRVLSFMGARYGASLAPGARSAVRVLDLGTAAGAQAFAMAAMGFSVTGVDASRLALARCSKRNEGLDNPVSLIRGDVTALPCRDGVFDAVIDCATLQHLARDDCRRAIIEALRVLKPNGRMLAFAAADDYHHFSAADRYLRKTSPRQVAPLYLGFVDIECRRAIHIDRAGWRVSWLEIRASKPKDGE